MVQVNNSSKKSRISLHPSVLSPYSWFEYKGMLYLSIKWREEKDSRWILDAVCFDPDFYTIQAEFCGHEEIKIIPIADSNILITYKNDDV